MNILAFEGTAHTISSSVLNNKEIISLTKKSFSSSSGMKPREVAEHHLAHIKEITSNALDEANLSIKDIDFIAYSAGPGMTASLQYLKYFVKVLSYKYKITAYPIHHSFAHLIVANYTTAAKDPLYLYVSGGNTQIIALYDLEPVVYGETEDIAIGNAFDKLSRLLGYGFPGGKIIEDLASKGKELVELVYTIKGMDVSFSGILTKASHFIGKYRVEDIAFSFQEYVFAIILEAAERALSYTGKEEFVVVGGVGLNKTLQEKARVMCEERGVIYYKVNAQYLSDNAAMIGIAGYHLYRKGIEGLLWNDLFIKPRWRIEDHLFWTK